MADNYDIITFFIPFVHRSTDVESIREEFRIANIGYVDRVDFVESTSGNHLSVFVHLIPSEGTVMDRIIHAHARNETYKHYLSWSWGGYFWNIMKADNPLPDTSLNIHQLAHNMHIMTKKIIDMEQTIMELQERLSQAEQKVNEYEDINTNYYEPISPIPEWIDDTSDCGSLTMEDLSTSTAAATALHFPSRNNNDMHDLLSYDDEYESESPASNHNMSMQEQEDLLPRTLIDELNMSGTETYNEIQCYETLAV